MTLAAKQAGIILPAVTLRSVSRSHVGRVRSINEDRVFDCAEVGCWAVVDGMGGHRGGDVAAQIVVDRLRATSFAPETASADMVDALHEANEIIHRNNLALDLQAGATVVAAVLEEAKMTIAWAGDSRAYLIRNGTLAQLTHDHSFVQELVDAGLLDPSEAERHPKSNIVTRALGVNRLTPLDRVDIDPIAGDRYLLCSDGLSRSLRSDDLALSVPIDALASSLLDSALRRDGSDNVSLVIIEVDTPA